MVLNGGRDVLILDGDCGLCHRLAEFIDKRIMDKEILAFRPSNSEDAELLFSKMPESIRDLDTVYLIRGGNGIRPFRCGDTLSSLHGSTLEVIISCIMDYTPPN